MPGKDPGGIIVTMLIGAAGSMLAYWIGSSTGRYENGESVGIIASIVGSMLILFIYRLAFNRRVTH